MKRLPLYICIASLFMAAPLLAQQASAPATTPELPPAPTHYLGREIATTMHWQGAGWLVRANREREENATLMLSKLGVKPGMTVCDLGCGNGYHTLRIGKTVGEAGKVYGVDIQQPMLDMLMKRAQASGVKNIVPVLATETSTGLPPESCDIILLVDVYHEVSRPEQVLASIHQALKPDGRLVLVEFRAEDPNVPIKPLHKMSKEQVNKELTANGYELAEEFDGLPWQHMMFFRKKTEQNEAAAPKR